MRDKRISSVRTQRAACACDTVLLVRTAQPTAATVKLIIPLSRRVEQAFPAAAVRSYFEDSMGEVIRWHDDDRLAKCWATEAKYRQMVKSGLVPAAVVSPDTEWVLNQMFGITDTAPCEYVAPADDPA